MSDEPNVTAYRLKPRNDFVVVREEKVDMIKGLFMPQVSKEGTQFIVEAIGPKVPEGTLKVGDVIRLNGQRGIHWDYVPNYQQLIIAREECVVLILEPISVPPAAEEVDPESLANPNRG